jgi:pre-mRNA-splicing helicase BRR2
MCGTDSVYILVSVMMQAVCNRYPNVSLEYEVVDADEVSSGAQVQINVKLERDNEVELGNVHAPHYPKEKEEAWWLLVGDPTTNALLSIKRVTLQVLTLMPRCAPDVRSRQ